MPTRATTTTQTNRSPLFLLAALAALVAALPTGTLAGPADAGPKAAKPMMDAASAFLAPTQTADGVVRIKSAYGHAETVERIKADVAAKGIMHFATIDQYTLAKAVALDIRPSTLIIFGNPPLGGQFLTGNPYSALDWPVRVLVLEEPDGSVSVAWTDFAHIEERYALQSRHDALTTATGVVTSIVSSVMK